MLRVKGAGADRVLPTTKHTELHVLQLVIWKRLVELRGRRREAGGFSEAVNSEMERQSFPK